MPRALEPLCMDVMGCHTAQEANMQRAMRRCVGSAMHHAANLLRDRVVRVVL